MIVTTREKAGRIQLHAPPSSGEQPKVLCATHLSVRSDQVIQRALDLCTSVEARSLLLYVVEHNLPLRLAGRRAERARDALEWHSREFSHLRETPEISVRLGPRVDTIVRAAREWTADLIVIGPEHRDALKGLAWSNAERIAHGACAPVLAVSTDLSEQYSGVTFLTRSKLDMLVHVANEFDLLDAARVSVVPPLPPGQRALLRLAEWTRTRAPRFSAKLDTLVQAHARRALEKVDTHYFGFERLSRRPTPRSLLARMKKAKGPQLLVAETDRCSFIARTYPTSAVLAALRHSVCDVLLVPASYARKLEQRTTLAFPRDAKACESST